MKKRLFLAYSVKAPWPEALPDGRHLDENSRHMTLVFLGNVEYLHNFTQFPKPKFLVGRTGYFDQCLFLPERDPRVAAWHAIFWDSHQLENYVQTLEEWIGTLGFKIDIKHPWLSHVTVARTPFDQQEWENSTSQLPFYIDSIQLYESEPNLKYTPISTKPLVLPFEELEHTADIAFKIHGENLNQIFWNAFSALSFQIPKLVGYAPKDFEPKSLDEIVIVLNNCVSHFDVDFGSPLKAISFHGELQKIDQVLEWEMIVDV